MSRRTMTRRTMTRAALRLRTESARGWRVHWAQVAARVDAGRVRPVKLLRPVRTVRNDDLSTVMRDEINAALVETLCDRVSREVPYTGETEVAYAAEFPLASAWLVFRDYESAPELAAVFERYGIVIDPKGWDEGWAEYRAMYRVGCDDCGMVNFGRPGLADGPVNADWPSTCHGCGSEALSLPHHTEIYGEDSQWWAACSCSWETPNSLKGERYAKGAVTRHLNKVTAETAAVA